MCRRCASWRNVQCAGRIVACVLLTLAACRTRPPSPPTPPKPPPDVAQHIPAHRPFDRRPYEFIWADRHPDQYQLMDFERVVGWRVEAESGVTGAFARDQTVQLWDDFVGAFRFMSDQDGGTARLIPPRPVRVHDPVDTVTCWVYGLEPSGTHRASPVLSLVIEDAVGQEHIIALGEADQPAWHLLSARLPAALRRPDAYPISITALQWSELPAMRDAVMYKDGLCMLVDAMDAIRYAPRPARPLELGAGQLRGINRGEDQLPFPTSTHAVLPCDALDMPTIRVNRPQPDVLEIQSADSEHAPRFIIHTAGGISEIVAEWDQGQRAELIRRVILDGLNEEVGLPIVVQRRPSFVYLEYERGDIYRLSACGASLIIDMAYRGGHSDSVSIVADRPRQDYASIAFPYLNSAVDVLGPIWRIQQTNLYTFIHLDPHRSNASTWQYEEQDEQVRWRAHYYPTTAGRKNDVHERLIVSAAPRWEDIWPATPNPDSAHQDNMRNTVWVEAANDGASYVEQQARIQTFASIGVRDVLYAHADTIWREHTASVGYRWRANPHRGGDHALTLFLEFVSEHGWRNILYWATRHLSPVNEFWDPNRIVRDVNGQWLRGRDGYVAKALEAIYWHQEWLPTVQTTFQSDGYHLDRFADQPPWAFTDYDRRAPGASTFSQVLYADGDMMLDMKRLTGQAVFASAVSARWMAGLVDGLVDVGTPDAPFNPFYKLNRLQAKAMIYGAPVSQPQANASEAAWDRYVAYTIGYGNAVRLVLSEEPPNLQHAARAVFSVRALQHHYAFTTPVQVLIGGEQQYREPETVFAGGTNWNGRLYKRYPGDVEMWVNGHNTRGWRVRVGDSDVALPPWGWLASGPGLHAFSALVNGARIDYVETSEYIFFDGRDQLTAYGVIQSNGPVVWWRDDPMKHTVIDLLGQGGIRVQRPDAWERMQVQVMCYDATGAKLDEGHLIEDGAWWSLEGPVGTHRYELSRLRS